MDRESITKEASDLLSVFEFKITQLNNNGLYSLNKISEDIYARLFNNLLDLELKNLNSISIQNFPAIDLLDEKQSIAFQITSDNSNSKVYQTLSTLCSQKINISIKELYIFSINRRQSKPNKRKIDQILSNPEKPKYLTFNINSHLIDHSFILNKLLLQEPKKAQSFLSTLREELTKLSDLLPNTNVQGTELFITFSNDNYDLALKTIEGLSKSNYHIYHDNAKLIQEPALKPTLRSITHLNATEILFKIRKCLAIISSEFLKQKWQKERYDPILQKALSDKAEIYVYTTNHSIIPAGLQSKNILYDPVKVNKLDFQKVINDFSEKSLLNGEIDNSPVWYKKFASVIAKVYPHNKIDRMAADETNGYEIYKSSDEILKNESFFICFHRGASLKGSCEAILNKHDLLNSSTQKIVLLPRERSLEISTNRMSLLSRYLNPTGIFFVEDFLIKCIPKQFGTLYIPFDIKDFIEPTIHDTSDTDLGYDWFIDWFDSPNKPILVIKGVGGVGKTTLVQKLADDYIKLKPNASVVYINSIEILAELERLKLKDHHFDLYYFYNAYIDKLQNEHHQIIQLDDDTFRTALDSGNILFILDGLDEVIAHFPQFNVNQFVKSTLDYSEDLGKANILITCRSYFWADSLAQEIFEKDPLPQISIVTIRPFDETLAQKYFETKLVDTTPHRQARIRRSMELAQSFINPKFRGIESKNNSSRYIPFVLSIINNMMEYPDQLASIESDEFETTYLSSISKTDYITHCICAREQLKIGQISINDQILFFITLSISSFAGSNLLLSFDDFDQILRNFNNYHHENARDSFKSHPLFKVEKSKKEICFRYDFLTEYFKSIYLANFLTGNNNDFPFGSLTIKLLANYVRINSGFSKELLNHIPKYNEQIHEKVKELIFECHNYDGSGIVEETRRRAMSGLTGLAILLHTNNNPQIDNNTALIKEIYGNHNTIENLHIVDYTSFDEHLKTVFDFSDVTLTECTFDNYDYFWECKTNQNTRFVKCTIKNLNASKFRGTNLTKENFNECTLDDWVKKVLDSKGFDISKKQLADLRKEFRNFLGLFISNGRPKPLSIKNNISSHQQTRKALVEYKVILKEMLASGLVEIVDVEKSHGDKVALSKSAEKQILDYFMQGMPSQKISEVINHIAANIP